MNSSKPMIKREKATKKQELNDKVNNYASRINSSVENGTFYYSVEFSSCVTHTSAALNHSGVLNIDIHPYLLHGQMYLWGNGMRPWMFSHMSNLK